MPRPKHCECGCGDIIPHGNHYAHGHNQRGKHQAPVTKEKMSEVRRENIKQADLEANVHRLYFPPPMPGESTGAYRFRKFEYFCEHYACHVKGKFAGMPVRLMEWQQDRMQKLLGTLDENEHRVFKKLFIHIGRKNGKTFLLCLLILYWLVEESFSDPAAEIVSCSGTRDQSIRNIFRTIKMIIKRSKELSQLLKVRSVPANITNTLTDAIYEPLSADGKFNLGGNLSLVVFDETLTQPNEELWSAMETGQGLREEPLFVSASTAGDSRSSFYYTIYELMKSIEANPESAPDTLVSIYEVPEEMDWQLQESFLLANPAAGEGGFRDPDEIKKMLAKAVRSEGKAAFRQFYLNQWSQHGARTLVPLERFDACCSGDLDIEALRDCRIVAGLDWSSVTDLTSLGLIIEVKKGSPEWIIYSFSWLAGDDLSECSKRDKLPYEKWIDDEVVFFEGKPTISVDAVKDLLGNLKSAFPGLKIIGFDPYLKDAMAPLEDYFEMVPVAQQYQFLSPPTKLLKAKILDKQIQCEKNPLLRAAIENARVLSDPSGNIRPDKSRSMSRIDPLVAVIIAANIAIREWR